MGRRTRIGRSLHTACHSVVRDAWPSAITAVCHHANEKGPRLLKLRSGGERTTYRTSTRTRRCRLCPTQMTRGQVRGPHARSPAMPTFSSRATTSFSKLCWMARSKRPPKTGSCCTKANRPRRSRSLSRLSYVCVDAQLHYLATRYATWSIGTRCRSAFSRMKYVHHIRSCRARNHGAACENQRHDSSRNCGQTRPRPRCWRTTTCWTRGSHGS